MTVMLKCIWREPSGRHLSRSFERTRKTYRVWTSSYVYSLSPRCSPTRSVQKLHPHSLIFEQFFDCDRERIVIRIESKFDESLNRLGDLWHRPCLVPQRCTPDRNQGVTHQRYDSARAS